MCNEYQPIYTQLYKQKKNIKEVFMNTILPNWQNKY